MTRPARRPAVHPAVGPRARAGTGLALLVGLALVAVPAEAAPTEVLVTSLTAADGEDVQVSGGGCTSPVQLVLAVPDAAGTGVVPADTVTVVPAPDGTWSGELTVQGSAAVVTAGCDGTTSDPVVVGDGGSGLDLVTGDRGEGVVTLGLRSFDAGSTLRVARPDGTVVAEATAAAGSYQRLEVSAPDDEVLVVLGLSRGVPVSELQRTPSGIGLTVGPRVAPTGGSITVTGTGCEAGGVGEVGLFVSGGSDDWYVLPTTYVSEDVTPGPDGDWQASFAMPAEVVAVVAVCRIDDQRFWYALPVPVGVADVVLRPTPAARQGGDVVVELGSDVEAFDLAGHPLVVEEVDDQHLVVRDAPDRFVLLDWAEFGENADPDAVNFSSPYQWTVDVTPAAVAPPAPPTPPAADPPAAAPVRGAELADTGPVGPALPSLGLVLVLVGAGCAWLSRRGRGGPLTTV